MIDEIGRCRRRCLDPCVGNHVEDAFVAFVSDACDDGQGEVGDVLREREGVETAEIGRGPAASDDYDTVELVQAAVDGVQGSDDRLLYLLALHDGGEESRHERISVVVAGKLVAEIAIAGSPLTGDDGDVLGEDGQCELPLQIEHPFGLQLLDDLQSLAGHVTEGIGRVDILHDP